MRPGSGADDPESEEIQRGHEGDRENCSRVARDRQQSREPRDQDRDGEDGGEEHPRRAEDHEQLDGKIGKRVYAVRQIAELAAQCPGARAMAPSPTSA